MDSLILLLLESSTLLSLIGLLVVLYGVKRAPVGFQHGNFFYYGVPPQGIIPVESPGSAPTRSSDWR